MIKNTKRSLLISQAEKHNTRHSQAWHQRLSLQKPEMMLEVESIVIDYISGGEIAHAFADVQSLYRGLSDEEVNLLDGVSSRQFADYVRNLREQQQRKTAKGKRSAAEKASR